MTNEKKIYTSFHDLSPREYMYFPKGTIDISKPGKFSRVEVIHLFISMIILTFVFGLVFTENNIFYALVNGSFSIETLPYGIGLAFVGILTGFFFHEISHKFMAQKYGLWSEYRMFPQGLRLALILGLFTPLVFAAPGAVMFRGDSRIYETGHIAMAGPLSNIIIALITLSIYLSISSNSIEIFRVIGFICYINAFLATFNLIPLGPLDGTKIIRWNATVWIIMLIISASILITIMPNLITNL
jgi:Zn-dependent protease